MFQRESSKAKKGIPRGRLRRPDGACAGPQSLRGHPESVFTKMSIGGDLMKPDDVA